VAVAYPGFVTYHAAFAVGFARVPVAIALKQRSILPGFGLTMGYTMLYVSLLVVIPLAGLFFKSATMPWAELKETLRDSELLDSLKLTFGLAFFAALINAFFGFIVAWTLVRYRFPGQRFIDGLIDLPFALPTAVSGITLATLYANNGWLGKPWTAIAPPINACLAGSGLSGLLRFLHLPEALPNQVAYSQLGMLIALVFIGVPFVVRTLQPALQDLDPEVEEAAASLGASRRQAFFRVVLPAFLPALLTGFSLSFARAVGEYGSVIFISSNIPGKTEITSHMIMKKLENSDYVGATTLGIIMLVVSFLVLIGINGLQWWSSHRTKGGTV
jgi:sulfate/thiosulfate transport system permease protein